MRRNRVKKLEATLSRGVVIIALLPPELDSRIPKGFFGRRINGGDLTIISKEELSREKANCKNCISVGEVINEKK